MGLALAGTDSAGTVGAAADPFGAFAAAADEGPLGAIDLGMAPVALRPPDAGVFAMKFSWLQRKGYTKVLWGAKTPSYDDNMTCPRPARLHYVKGDATLALACSGIRFIAHVCSDIGGWGSGFVTAIGETWSMTPQDSYRWLVQTPHDG